eukprot:TRINITY_DN32635_c0_g1_i2.p1 TRINITY_DN32635_c0_g1~~TRINITY_DN32635_c0_g1_i2.p1  ORF type:complete len:552 (-),score=106.61 TRINITY_DN32635_c0_g1_i2:133-1788(-)
MLTNLNLLHQTLERDFRSAVFPVFTIERDVEGGETGSKDVFRLQYKSSRQGLEPLLRGVLRKVAEKMFNMEVEIEVIIAPAACTLLFPLPARAGEETYLEWRLHLKPLEPKKAASAPPPVEAPTKPARPRLSFWEFHQIFMCCGSTLGENSCKGFSSPQDGIEAMIAFCGEDEEPEADLLSLRRKAQFVEAIYDPFSGEDPTSTELRVIAKALFRGVPARFVAAAWHQKDAMDTATDFWAAHNKLDNCYLWSEDYYAFSEKGNRDKCMRIPTAKESRGEEIITFISHSWDPPEQWELIMGRGCKYGSMKAAEICAVAKDLAAVHLGDYSRWGEVKLWVDKCCIPQNHPELMGWCLRLLEEFVMLSDRLLVVLTWSYFERLWCVYEWVCVLVHHEARSIVLCVDAFIRDQTLPLLVGTIKNFSLANCKCSVQSDRQLLEDKVRLYYVSQAAFEELLKFTAIALIARDMAVRRTAYGRQALKPWLQLAEECQFQDLATSLAEMTDQLEGWRHEAARNTGSLDMQTNILLRVEAWFAKSIEPMIKRRRDAAVKQ